MGKGMIIREKVESIRHAYQRGEISLDEAKTLVEPLILEINTKGARIAKSFGKTYKPLSFSYIFR